MITTLRRTLLMSVPLALLAAPSHASETEQPDLLKVLGGFVVNGLTPARTMEDIQREEREARARELAAKRKQAEDAKPEPVAVAPIPEAAPDPAPAAVAEPAPVKMARVEPTRPVAPEAKPAEIKVPEAKVDVIPPPPRARPHVEAKALPAAPTVPAEPLKSRIAATASVDQAVKLGGASQIYSRRLSVD